MDMDMSLSSSQRKSMIPLLRGLGAKAIWDASLGTYQDAAVQFTAADKSRLAMTSHYDPTTNDVVISVHVYLDTLSDYQTIICTGGTANGKDGFCLQVDSSGDVVLGVNDSVQGTRATATLAAGLSTGTWYHLVLFLDRSGNATLYIDGPEGASLTLDISGQAASMGSGGGNIGADTTPGNYFDGRIDSLMIFEAADLSGVAATILAATYNSGEGLLVSDITAAQQSAWGATHGYEMGEGTGTRYDSWGVNHLSQAFAEIVTNGKFTGNSAGWTEGANWSYGTNDEDAAAADANLSEDTVIATAGKLYTTIFEITVATTGSVRLVFGGTNGTTRSTAATFTEILRATSAAALVLDPVATFTGTIDNVSVLAAEILAGSGIARGAATDANHAIQLNGDDQYADQSGAEFDWSTNDRTFGIAGYLDMLPTNGGTLFSAGTDGAGNDFFWIYIRVNGTIRVTLNDSTATVTGTSVATVIPGEWNTIIIDMDRDGNCSLILNGGAPEVLMDISGKATSLDPGELFVGRYSPNNTFNFPGRLDNAFTLPRRMTSDEIAWIQGDEPGQWRQHAECGVAGNDGSTLTDFDGFFEFDDASDLGADSTSNGNDLTPRGTPTQGNGINYLAGKVSRWEDQVSSFHGTISTLAKRPSLVRGTVVNTEWFVRFDGVDDLLDTTLAAMANASIYFVGKMNAASDVAFGVEDTGNRSYVGSGVGPVFAGGVAGQDEATIKTDEDPSADYFIGSLQYDGSTVKVYVDGVEEYSAAQSGAVSSAETYAIGANNNAGTPEAFADGDVLLIAAFDSNHTDGFRKKIMASIAKNYGM